MQHRLSICLLSRRAIAARKLAVLLLVVAGFCPPDASTGFAQQPGAKGQPPAPVRVAPVQVRTILGGQSYVGTVTPLRRSVIGSAVAGRVVEFVCNEGDYVKQGQTLAQILTGTIEIELSGAKAELLVRQAELNESIKSFPAEKEQAAARSAAARARHEHAQSKLERVQALRKKASISEEAVDEAMSAALETEAAYREAEAARHMIFEGAREQKIEQLRAKVRAQEEAVHLIEDRLAKYTIKAYFDGYVTAEHTEVGHWVKDGEPVVEVCDIASMDVRVNVPEDYVVQLAKGNVVRVEIGALPDRAFTGTIEAVVPQADLRARTFPVLVRVANPRTKDGHLLKGGMLARAILPVGKQEQALLISKDAIVLGGKAPMVYAVDVDAATPGTGSVRPVPVELGVADGSEIQIRGPLRPGELVVVEGNERLRPGQPVAFRMPNAEASAPARGQQTGGR
jgi:HlyD family secretion protein